MIFLLGERGGGRVILGNFFFCLNCFLYQIKSLYEFFKNVFSSKAFQVFFVCVSA